MSRCSAERSVGSSSTPCRSEKQPGEVSGGLGDGVDRDPVCLDRRRTGITKRKPEAAAADPDGLVRRAGDEFRAGSGAVEPVGLLTAREPGATYNAVRSMSDRSSNAIRRSAGVSSAAAVSSESLSRWPPRPLSLGSDAGRHRADSRYRGQHRANPRSRSGRSHGPRGGHGDAAMHTTRVVPPL
jgi:hypothetical protein